MQAANVVPASGYPWPRVRSRGAAKIATLLAFVALVPAAAIAASTAGGGSTGTGGASAPPSLEPTGPTGTTSHTGATGHTGSTGSHTGTTGASNPPPTIRPLSTTPLAHSSVAHLHEVMARAMKPLGPNSGAYVVDLTNGEVLYDQGGDERRYPASVEKLYTLTTALDKFGLDGTLETSVYADGTLAPDGTFTGNLYLHGGGDPTFGNYAFIKENYGGVGTTVGALATKLIAALHLHKIDGSIIGDESYFDSLRGDPASDYQLDPNLVGELSALSFNRGSTGSGQSNPAGYAALQLAQALRHDGVPVSGHSKAGVMDRATAHLVTEIASPTMAKLAALTAAPSDDFFAEMLLKGLGARFGAGGTTGDGAVVVRDFLATLGIEPQIVDGSGLSREDLTTPMQVVQLLRDLSPDGIPSLTTIGTTLRDSLAVVSDTGTLEFRMPHTVASGYCQAKTGTLSDASDLAGWCGSLAFAYLMNHIDVWSAQDAQDTMTEALAALAKR
jgi:D-alanyl-D-alanine carboxypeptidase/D-alanyl-D-alanine-endopeptidase (penicillin-binding protein 4)